MPESYNTSTITEQGGRRSDARWFAAYTATHHEKHVQKQLTDRQVESFLPLYRAPRQWKKSKPVTLELPLFPNYVFVRIAQPQRTAVLGIPGVLALVGSGREAWELPEQEIEALRCAVQLRKLEPHSYLVVGERARVRSGVLAGLEGIIVRKKSNLHIVLSLDQIMQSVAIEVEGDELEPLSSSSQSWSPNEPFVAAALFARAEGFTGAGRRD